MAYARSSCFFSCVFTFMICNIFNQIDNTSFKSAFIFFFLQLNISHCVTNQKQRKHLNYLTKVSSIITTVEIFSNYNNF